MNSQQTQELSNVRLHYFPANGRASFIRAILHWKKVPFEDLKYNYQEWGQIKKSGDFEFEQIPMLEINGKKLTQSFAILIYLGRLFNILGNSPFEEYLIVSLINSYEDVLPKMISIIFAKSEEQKEQSTKDFLNIHAPFMLKRWEARFLENGKDYMVGDSFSLADIFVTVSLFNIFKNKTRKETWEPVLNEYAPNLSKLIDRIVENELSDYLKNGYAIDATF